MHTGEVGRSNAQNYLESIMWCNALHDPERESRGDGDVTDHISSLSITNSTTFSTTKIHTWNFSDSKT